MAMVPMLMGLMLTVPMLMLLKCADLLNHVFDLHLQHVPGLLEEDPVLSLHYQCHLGERAVLLLAKTVLGVMGTGDNQDN